MSACGVSEAALLDALGNDIQPEKVRAIFMYGSRVYGTALPNSDYDILIIQDNFINHAFVEKQKFATPAKTMPTASSSNKEYVAGYVLKKMNNDMAHMENKHDKNITVVLQDNKEIEAHIMDTKLYLDLLQKHNAVAMLTVWLPDEYVLREDEQIRHFRKFWTARINLQMRKVQYSFVREAEVWCFSKARRLWNIEKDIKKSKKNVVHGIRYLLFATQIVKHGAIVNYHEAVEYHEKVILKHHQQEQQLETAASDSHEDEETFATYEKEYKPIYEQLTKKISDIVHSYTDWGIELYQGNTFNHQMLIQHFVKEYGVPALAKHFCIRTVPIASYPEKQIVVVKFVKDDTYSKRESKLVQEIFQGVICAIGYKHQELGLKLDFPQEYNMLLDHSRFVSVEALCYSYPMIQHAPNVYETSFIEANNVTNPSEARIHEAQQAEEAMKSLLAGKVTYKINGTLCVLYHFFNQWRFMHPGQEKSWLSTISNHPHANLEDKLKLLWQELGYRYPTEADASKCYMFELVDTETSRTTSPEILLHGVRDMKTLKEEFDTLIYASKYNWKQVPTKSLADYGSSGEEATSLLPQVFTDLLNEANDHKTMNPLRCSGFIITIPEFNAQESSASATSTLPSTSKLTVLHKFKLESALFYYLNHLRVWDVQITSGKPVQSLYSLFNELCMLQIFRNTKLQHAASASSSSNTSTTSSSAEQSNDEMVVIQTKALFIEMYKKMKTDYTQICGFINSFFKEAVSSVQSSIASSSTTSSSTPSLIQKEMAKQIQKFPLQHRSHLFYMAKRFSEHGEVPTVEEVLLIPPSNTVLVAFPAQQQQFAKAYNYCDAKSVHATWKQYCDFLAKQAASRK